MTFHNFFPGRGTLMECAFLAGKERGRVNSWAEDRVNAIVRILDKTMPVSGEARQRIMACTDPDTLTRWLDRTIHVRSINELFADGSPADNLRGTLLERAYLAGKAEGEAESRADAYARGLATGIVRVLTARGLPLCEEARRRIMACTDPDTLTRWLDATVHVAYAEAVFAEYP
ncbi:hypothetical protein SRB5_65560 [Streptomyces sp. RB5]|uniref:Uncharacterized protein n=1 Tax=Streptomyces smaragdinus TaxID=2585196 RepID=A0A7K0CSF7_9ACTN|nr:hypothetical protein [Streptomyces smaragdinus]MQY16358.1 hypothetical protein [Streptomyces smaragdinus]